MTPQEYQQNHTALCVLRKTLAEDKGYWRKLTLAEKDAYAGLAANVLIESVIAPEPWLKIWGFMTRRVKRAEQAVIEMTRLLDEQALQLGNYQLCVFWTMVRQKIQAGEHTQAFCW